MSRGARPDGASVRPPRRRAARTHRRIPTEDLSTVAKQRNRKPARRRDKKGGPGSGRRKPCLFCKDKVEQVDYKDVATLRKFISERGKIRSRRITGACRRHQSQVARAVKRARELALLPYVAEARDERGDRGERGERGERGGRDRERER
jgi:small subunit ribosomal protein S18